MPQGVVGAAQQAEVAVQRGARSTVAGVEEPLYPVHREPAAQGVREEVAQDGCRTAQRARQAAVAFRGEQPHVPSVAREQLVPAGPGERDLI